MAVWYVPYSEGHIYRLSETTGAVLGSIPTPVSGTLSVAVGPTGDLWCSETGSTIRRISPTTGAVLQSFAAPRAFIRDLAFDGNGALWAVEDAVGTIYRLSTVNGAVLQSFATPASGTRGIAFDVYNRLWVLSGDTDLIYRLSTSDGAVLQSFATPEGNSFGLAGDPDGNLWTTGDAADKLYRVTTSSGAVTRSFGTPDSGWQPVGVSWDAVIFNQPPNAPTLTAPAGGETIDRNSANRFDWDFSDPDAGDSQSKFDLRYRAVGASTWTDVTGTIPNTYWDALAGTFAAGDYEWQVRTYDAQGVVGPYSSSAFFTAAEAPPGPTWLDPINGQTIGASDYTGTISAPNVDASEWTLYADNAGSIDTATILQGPVTKTTGDLRSHTWTGLTNNTTVWWSVRIKGGGLWLQPAQIRTPVSYTPPPDPVVSLLADDASGALAIAITNPTPTGEEPAAVYNDVEIDDDDGKGFQPRHGSRMVPINSIYTYWEPRATVDYSDKVRVTAVAENGATASTTTTTTTEPPVEGFYGGY